MAAVLLCTASAESQGKRLLGVRREMLALEPSACLPSGFRLEDTAAGLQLIRQSDGERLGIMSSFEFACDYAATMARIEAQRLAQEEMR